MNQAQLNNPQVPPADLENKLRTLVDQVDSDVESDRLRLFLEAQKHDLYFRGITRVVPTVSDGVIRMTALSGMNTDDQEPNVKEYTLNKVHGDGKKFVSLLGMKVPNVKGVPDDPRSEDDRVVAKQYDAASAIFKNWWDVEEKQLRLALHVWKYGTVFGYVRWVADGERFGNSRKEVFASEDALLEPERYVCPSCGEETPVDQVTTVEVAPAVFVTQCECGQELTPDNVAPAETAPIPASKGFQEYPNGRVELSLANVTNVRVPFDAVDIADCYYLFYELEVSKALLLAAHPELREKLKSAPAKASQANQTGVQVRESATSPSGNRTKRGDHMTYMRAWFRPAAFELIDDDAVREYLKQNFKSGIKLTMVDGIILKYEEENLVDHWAYCPAETSDYIYSDAICKDMIDYQDARTDATTIAMETFERGLPVTIFSPDVLDPQVLNKRASIPAEMIPAKAGSGNNIKDATSTVATPRFPDQLPPFIGDYEQGVREVTGVLPPAWGGGEGQMTLGEFTRRQNQAIAVLGTQWTYMRRFWVQCHTNAISELAKYGIDQIAVPYSGKGEGKPSLDVPVLASGNAHYECDEAIPQSFGQQRDRLTELMQQAPMALDALGVFHPENIPAVKDLIGLPMLVAPGEDARDRIHEVIEQLLRESPVEAEGGPPKPSIDPDDVVDNPADASAIIRAWMQSKAGRAAANENPSGYANVRAYLGTMLAASQPPPEGPPGKAGPPPAGKPPGAAPPQP